MGEVFLGTRKRGNECMSSVFCLCKGTLLHVIGGG